MKITRIFLSVTLLAVLLLVLPASAAGDARCPSAASVCVYAIPSDVQAAREACYRAAREARGIPGDTDAYVMWFEAHRGTPAQLDWTRAHTACRHAHTQPGGLWNWSALVFVGWR